MSDKMGISEFHDEFKSFMEKDTRGSQLGIYSAAGLALAVAVYKIKPFRLFTHPKQIPKKFIIERVQQKGQVIQIEPTKSVLLINHHPPLRIPFLHWGNPGLPVKILGIELSGNAISWLQTIVSGNKVKFVPISTNNDFVNCIVTMDHKTFDKKHPLETLNIGEYLVKIGLAKVGSIEDNLTKDQFTKGYKNKLKSAQLEAQRRSRGMWTNMSGDVKLITRLQWFLLDNLSQIFQFLIARSKKLAVTLRKK
uniref:Protein c3orf33 log nasonia vitripennis n=1 Tax=Xenopsylla cheopis TaxID=163159 RepID=A0A6M2DQP8_XENCH